jgi:hypothetical protein
MKLSTNLTVAYSQIYLEDYSCASRFHEGLWKDEELSSMLCVGGNFIVIGTVRSMEVPFYIEILEGKPQIDLNSWDHVNECSIEISSGLAISGDFDDEGEMLKINLQKRIYGIFVCYKGLGTISWDGIEGDDSYHAFIWPTDYSISKQILKRWKR